jgi:hypothetical protein
MKAHPSDFDIVPPHAVGTTENSDYFFIFVMGLKSGIRSSLKAAQIDKGAIGELYKMQALIACYHAGIAEILRFGQSSKQGRVLDNELWANIQKELENF